MSKEKSEKLTSRQRIPTPRKFMSLEDTLLGDRLNPGKLSYKEYSEAEEERKRKLFLNEALKQKGVKL